MSIRSIDNAAVLRQQCERLSRLRAERARHRVDQCLAEVTRAAGDPNENLLGVVIEAVRARATVGEVSLALERVFGRFQANTQGVMGVYGSYFDDDEAWQRLRARVESFARSQGRQPRLAIAKLGQDGHDRGAKVVAAGLSDLGFDVDLGPLFQTPREAAESAVDSDAHLVGVSTQAGAHVTLIPELVAELRRLGAPEILVVCGGIIPEQDRPALLAQGVAGIFEPGASLPEIAEQLLTLLEERDAKGS